MNAERLLSHFDKISDAPQAIPRLRRFILDLAVRGMLVKQGSDDGQVVKLLERRKIATSRDGPFELPASWVWVNVGSVAVARLGKMLDKSKNKGTPRRYLRNINVRWFNFDLSDIFEMRFEDSELPEFAIRPGDVLVCEGGEPGRAAVWDGRESNIYFQKAIHRIRFLSFVDSHFFVKALRASADDERLGEYFTGTGIKHFTGKGLAAYLFPLPPLTEQHRIVARVDELMKLCDRLDAVRFERKTTRSRLAAARLALLNAPDPDPTTFQNHAAFALENLTPLTTRPDQIKALRQTILNLAVLGKLVPQDPSGEPATELLEHIASERVPKKRKTKTTIELNSSISESDPPPGWVVATLQSVCDSITDGDHLPPPKTESGIPFLVIGNVRSQTIEFTGSRFVSPEYYKALALIRRPSRGDLLYTLVGSYGIPVVVRDDRPFCVQRHIGILRPSRFIDVDFLACAMGSRSVFEQATACATGIAQKTVPLSGLRRLLIPLPPLTEQRRIVAKVDELMTLCDRLETTLAAVGNTRHRLLDAVLHDALAPRTEPKTAAGRLGYASGEGRRF